MLTEQELIISCVFVMFYSWGGGGEGDGLK